MIKIIGKHFKVSQFHLADGRYCVTVEAYEVKRFLFVKYKEYVDTLYYADWEDYFKIYEGLVIGNPNATWEVNYSV